MKERLGKMENQSVIEEIYKADDFLKEAQGKHDFLWLFNNREAIENFFFMADKIMLTLWNLQ